MIVHISQIGSVVTSIHCSYAYTIHGTITPLKARPRKRSAPHLLVQSAREICLELSYTSQAATPTAKPATPPTAPALTMPATFFVDADGLTLPDVMEETRVVMVFASVVVARDVDTDRISDTAVDEVGTLGGVSGRVVTNV